MATNKQSTTGTDTPPEYEDFTQAVDAACKPYTGHWRSACGAKPKQDAPARLIVTAVDSAKRLTTALGNGDTETAWCMALDLKNSSVILNDIIDGTFGATNRMEATR